MDAFVFVVVLSAALMHAIWNSIIQKSKNSFIESFNFGIWKIPLTLCLVFILPIPDKSSWPFIACSVCVHFIYTYTLVYSYNNNDLTKVYPIFRGAPPLIVLIFSYLFLNEVISSIGWLAVVITSIGILSISLTGKRIDFKSMFSVTLVAVSIVAYSIIDGLGARASLNSLSYLSWVFLIHWSLYTPFILNRYGWEACISHTKNNLISGMFASLISFIGYSLILWAMTKVPIAYVVALRETSIIFVGIIGWLFLSEKLSKIKILSIIIIALGAVLLRLS